MAEYKRSPAFAGYHIFVPTSHIERYIDDAVFRFYETKKDDPIMAAANSFGEIINIHPFEDGNGMETKKDDPIMAAANSFGEIINIHPFEDGNGMETKKDDPIMVAANSFGEVINIHPFEDGNGIICRLILAHVLIQMKWCLFPVIFSSFHRRGRRHYIRAVKMFDRKPSKPCTMIIRSLNFAGIILSKMQRC